VTVFEFAIGYPPRIFGFRRGETEYTLNLLPLGGFVRLLGEEDPSDPHSLAAQAAWKRLIVMGAGAFMNFVLAIGLFALALMIPREVPAGNAVIAQVVPDSPAAKAGIKPGDIILEIDGRKIDSVPEASYNIRLNLGEDTEIKLRRTDPITRETTTEIVHVTPRWAPPLYTYEVQPGDTVDKVSDETGFSRDTVRQAAGIETLLPVGRPITIEYAGDSFVYTPVEGDTVAFVAVTHRVSEEAVATAAGLPDPNTLAPGTTLQFVQGATGIQIAPQYAFTETRSLGFFSALGRGWQSCFDSLKLARNEIYSWIKGGSAAPVSGPIGIAQATGEVFREAGWKSLMDLAALLSVNLAILNILPLPMLDGGRIAFVLLEIARRGRRIAPAKEALVHFVGMVAILILVVVLSYFDVARIVRGDALFR
jgi:regulator of sigma E protease